MTIMTVMLSVFLPRYCTGGKIYEMARKLLIGGTTAVVIHFIIQFYIGYKVSDIQDIRTTINLFFGFPITYFFNMSLIYVIKRGHIKKNEWCTIPFLYLLGVIIYIYFALSEQDKNGMRIGNTILAFFYGLSLIYVSYVEISSYFKINKSIKARHNASFIPIMKWTKWSVFFMLLISLGYPIMTFHSNNTIRAFYGIISLSSGLVYTFSFIGYGLSRNQNEEIKLARKKHIEELKENNSPKVMQINVLSQRQMEIAMKSFEDNEFYTKQGIKVKEAAELMGTTVYMLNKWLSTTKYCKFTIWINKLRVKKAKEVLSERAHITDSEVARMCGFCDRQYFQKVFIKYEGISPSEWAKRN